MTTVSLDQMNSKLVTMDEVHRQLAKTEPLASIPLTSDSRVKFRFNQDWAADLDATADIEPVAAVMSIDGHEHRLTRAAALQTGANFGLSAPLMKKLPSKNLEQDLNWFYSGGFGDKTSYNVLTVADTISAFTRPTLLPFSNIRLLDNLILGIQRRYGSDTPIFADYKFVNTLQQTDLRLVVPEYTRELTETGMGDVPAGESDLWLGGLHLSNSAIGKKQTTIEAYLFRWWCTNGATTTNREVGVWSRRSDGQNEDVYDWARRSVNEIFDGMAERFDQVQALTALDVGSNFSDVLREVFSQHKVPVSQREEIQDTIIQADTLTMYTMMQAITQAANGSGLKPARADQLMRIGGEIPTATFDTLKAQVWREGHTASPSSPNPYEIVAV